MVAGFLLAWPRAFPIRSMSFSGRLPIIALFRLGMMFFPCNRTVKGSHVFQRMAGLTEEIDIFNLFVGKRSFQSPCIAKICGYPYAGFLFDKIVAISQLQSQSHQLVTKVIDLTGLDSQIIPLPNNTIPIRVSTKT